MKVTEINIYPIKSLRSISLGEAKVEERGLEFDRRWMLVDETGKFISQRELPLMATISVGVTDEGLQVLNKDGDALDIAFDIENRERVGVKVWSSSVKAGVYSSEIDEWFSDALGIGCRLVAMTPESKRLVNPLYAVRRFEDTVSFADGYPFLLANETSLADLNGRLAEQVPMDRFRPNIVVSGAQPWGEDDWKRIRIGEAEFHVVKPCARCVMTTIDQQKGVKTGTEPLRTLATFRRKGDKVLFGQNLIADEPGTMIHVGDVVEVLESKRAAGQ